MKLGYGTLDAAVLYAFVIPVLSQYSVEILDRPNQRGIRYPIEHCEATGATFGADVIPFSFSEKAKACAVSVSPELACGPVEIIPPTNVTVEECHHFFAVVPRGKCNFSEKAYYVQTARYTKDVLSAVIIYNDKGKPPVDMNGGKFSELVTIPVVMISYHCMERLMFNFTADKGYMVQIKISPGYYDLFRYLIPFVVVVGFCFIVLLISLAIRLCRERRRIARKRLSKRNLKKIPTKKFRKGDEQDTCAICLEEFVDGERLRVLPCRHTYHCACIDPWLTQNRKVCPMCKRRVGAKNSDSESSDDERRVPPPISSQPSTSGSTMTFQVEDEHQGHENAERLSSHPSSSNVVVDVEVHRNQGLGGSTEQLVDEDFLLNNSNYSEDEAEPEPSLSQSLKKRLKGLFNRSGNDAGLAEEFGRINGGFQGSSHSVADAGRASDEEHQNLAEHDELQQEHERQQNEHDERLLNSVGTSTNVIESSSQDPTSPSTP